MSQIIEGVLVYDYANERYQIGYGIEQYTSGLHCGECLQVYCEEDGKWYDARIEMEMDGEWYLAGCPEEIKVFGAKVRYQIQFTR